MWASGALGAPRGCWGNQGVSGVHWGLAGTLGTQEPEGICGHQGHWGLLRGVRGALGLAGTLGTQGPEGICGHQGHWGLLGGVGN